MPAGALGAWPSDVLISRAVVIPADDDVAWAYARLRAACRLAGHALHDGPRRCLWIAATAVAHRLPLVTDDGVFAGVPGLTALAG
jgi:predicted nucleic acid-binding protein